MARKVSWVWPGALLLLLVAACAPRAAPIAPTPTDGPAPTPTAGKPPIVVPGEVPAVDTSRHSVPLEEIYFDTFRATNRAVPLSVATADLIDRLRDAIPPIHEPQYEPAAEVRWLSADDPVLGYAAGGQAWAYPLRILNLHEIVNDHLDGEPVLISYCPLCYSGVVYSRRLDDQVLTFGNTSALYESDMVMLDYETGSYWWQVAGTAIVGPLTDKRLTTLPSLTTTFGQWVALHPGSWVLSRDTGYQRDYGRNPFANYESVLARGAFAFPVSDAGRDDRLSPEVKVLAVQVGDAVHGYPLTGDGPAVRADNVGGQDIVVFIDPASATGAAFTPTHEGQALTFQADADGFVDDETGSRWNLAGTAVAGPLQGAQLTPLPTKTSFWFAIVAAEPDIVLAQ